MTFNKAGIMEMINFAGRKLTKDVWPAIRRDLCAQRALAGLLASRDYDLEGAMLNAYSIADQMEEVRLENKSK